MTLLIGLILPLIIIALPIVGQIYWSKKAYKKCNLTYSIVIGIIALVVGLFTPIIATFLSTYGLAWNWNETEPACVTGAGVFFFFGYIATFITIPLTISYSLDTYRRKKWLESSVNNNSADNNNL